MNRHSLYVILCSTGSQRSCLRAGFTWSRNDKCMMTRAAAFITRYRGLKRLPSQQSSTPRRRHAPARHGPPSVIRYLSTQLHRLIVGMRRGQLPCGGGAGSAPTSHIINSVRRRHLPPQLSTVGRRCARTGLFHSRTHDPPTKSPDAGRCSTNCLIIAMYVYHLGLILYFIS